MSFARYPKYKDSGVPWLGEVPEHWNVSAARYVTEFTTGWTPPTGDDSAYQGDNLWANISDLSARQISDTAKRISDEAVAKADIRISPVGSLLFSFKLSIGQVSFVNAAMYTNEAIATFHPSGPLSLDFAYYALPLFLVQNAAENIYGAKLLNQQLIRSARLCLPSVTEQSTIAAFLDRETAKIDALVAEQGRLIELLKEKRQAVISHAVTKGLNPNAKLKPSGIDWLGDVPEHWEVCSVRRIIDRIEQGWSPECYARPAEPEEWGVLKSGCVNRGVLNEEENKALPETLSPLPEYEVKAGDVLISRASGSPELVGSTAYVSAIRPRLMLSDKTFRIHLEPAIAKRFFVAAFNSRFLRDQIERAISGAEGLANNLPQSALLTFAICVPPVEEQEAIVQRLEEEIGKLNALTAAAERAISLLQERRTALISAAVTGKIDVRDVGSMEVT